MAVLGQGGRLVLKRPYYEGTHTFTEWQLDPTCHRINGAPSWLWNGDQISAIGLPIYCDGGIPGKVSGFASYYGSKWYLGPNRDHITAEDHKFYKQTGEEYPTGKEKDAANFYAKNGVGDVPDEDCGANGDYWVHIDQFGNISFYDNRCSALKGCKSDRIELAPVAGDITIGPKSSFDYQNAEWQCVDGPCSGRINDYYFSDVQDNDTDESICASAPAYDKPVAGTGDYENADVQPRSGQGFPGWQILCDMREWSLELDAPAVDTTAVSEKWGNNIKSIVAGGGSLEFYVDRACYGPENDNALVPMQLLMMTEHGCEAEAQFWMMDEPVDCGPGCNPDFGGGLYYSAKILITQTAVNLRPTELIAGTAQFVTTEEIRLIAVP